MGAYLTEEGMWAFYPNAGEVRDDYPESFMSDEELEQFWRDETPATKSGYFIPRGLPG